ncbi:unnamed protein product [Penicillium roqueforti FM164]|uniref:Genomic scaffold, ProqFM164S01 n=1 Tax=Penicillium roqueforti (strain FM164) TaxID=1365484 RepID=W6Q4B2_PENRF|nr:unnamed protein product [Penicillium roqueforti FM164]
MKEAWLATEKKKVWENDEPFSPADEWSESVLCLGRPTDESSREAFSAPASLRLDSSSVPVRVSGGATKFTETKGSGRKASKRAGQPSFMSPYLQVAPG